MNEHVVTPNVYTMSINLLLGVPQGRDTHFSHYGGSDMFNCGRLWLLLLVLLLSTDAKDSPVLVWLSALIMSAFSDFPFSISAFVVPEASISAEMRFLSFKQLAVTALQ
jgi:hypothetical protein